MERLRNVNTYIHTYIHTYMTLAQSPAQYNGGHGADIFLDDILAVPGAASQYSDGGEELEKEYQPAMAVG